MWLTFVYAGCIGTFLNGVNPHNVGGTPIWGGADCNSLKTNSYKRIYNDQRYHNWIPKHKVFIISKLLLDEYADTIYN